MEEPYEHQQAVEMDEQDIALHNTVFTSEGGMNPDHPLLARAQQALKQQLLTNKKRLEDELREKQTALKTAKQKREDVGVELYGFQQHLAKLQMTLEKTQSTYDNISKIRTQAEQNLAQMRQQCATEATTTQQEKAKLESFQSELDKLSSNLRQVTAYNEEVKGEIAVTRRAAYAAEEAVQKLEKEKMQQDYLIDGLQENLKKLNEQQALYSAQLSAQQHETRAAQETLAQAESEMESIHFEKRQLLAQWKSSLTAIQKRDEALSAIADSVRQQQQQEMSLVMEIEGYKKDIIKEQVRSEQLTAVVKKLEGEAEFLARQVSGMVEKQERLMGQLSKLAKSLEVTEDKMRRAQLEAKAVASESDSVERAVAKVNSEVRGVEEEMVTTLGEQTTAEKSSARTRQDIGALRKRVREEELQIADAQNEMAKLQVDILNTEAHNDRLAETLAMLHEELTNKESTISKYETELKRRTDEIEKKTRDMDTLNKKYDKMVSSMNVDVNTGPLEATINHLQKEIDTKNSEGRDLQRRWINHQVELVGLQQENGRATEALVRMRAEHTVLFQKRARLDAQFEAQQKELKTLAANMAHLHTDLQRINGLIAQNSELRGVLAEDNFNLESKIMCELRELEEGATRLRSHIEQAGQNKRDILSDIVETERQIMLWERKIQLVKEMQAVLDPTVGNDVVTVMKKEIHRMELRHTELLRLQEKLMQDLERALSKREIIGVKAQATSSKAASASANEAQLRKAVSDLQNSIRDNERELAATDQRMGQLEQQRQQMLSQLEQADGSCRELQQQQEDIKLEVAQAAVRRYKLLLATTRHQRMAKRLEELEAGKCKPSVEDPATLDAELAKAKERQAKIVSVLEGLRTAQPELAEELDKILCHVS